MKITEESMKQPSQDIQGSAPSKDAPPAPMHEKSEKEKLKSMSVRDRAWYVWAYYKFHILAAVVAVVLLFNIGSAMYRSSFDTVLYCIYLNSRGETEVDPAPLEQDFAKRLEMGKKDLIATEISYISFGDNATDYSYASMAKISALGASRELDIIIGDEESTIHYASLNALLDLEATLPPDILSLVKEHLYYAENESGENLACAIDLSGTDFAKKSNLSQDPPLLTVMANSRHIDTAEALIRYIFEP